MPSLQKTVIVTPTYGGYPHSIRAGVEKLAGQPGVVLVEAGEYDILSALDVVRIPAYTSIIGLGGVMLNLKIPLATPLISATGVEEPVLTNIGVKICEQATLYADNLIFFQNIRNGVIEKVSVRAERAELIHGGVAILLYARDGDCRGNLIDRCRVENYAGIGYYLATHPTYTTPMPNTCNDNTLRGCYTSRCNAGAGLLRASGNDILSNRFLYSLRSAEGGHEGTQGHDGIVVQESNDLRITGNDLSGNIEHGLYLSGCKRATVHNNRCSDNFSVGIHVRYAGTDVAPVDDSGNTLTANVCDRNGIGNPNKGVGIHFQEYANRNDLIGNFCRGNAGDGLRIHLVGATRNTVAGNVCHGNGDNQLSVETSGNFVGVNYTE